MVSIKAYILYSLYFAHTNKKTLQNICTCKTKASHLQQTNITNNLNRETHVKLYNHYEQS